VKGTTIRQGTVNRGGADLLGLVKKENEKDAEPSEAIHGQESMPFLFWENLGNLPLL
jgi:hypothetical protein